MKISDAIDALEACLDAFGDVECSFAMSQSGNPAIELKNVDTAHKPDVAIDKDKAEEEAYRRFCARFPVSNIFTPSRN